MRALWLLILIVLAAAGCTPPATAERAERLLNGGQTDDAETVAMQAIADPAQDGDLAKRIVDEVRLRRVIANTDAKRALKDFDVEFYGEHHREQARSHVILLARAAVEKSLIQYRPSEAFFLLEEAPAELQGALAPERIKTLLARAEKCAGDGRATCVQQTLEKLALVDPKLGGEEQKKLAGEAWSQEVQEWRQLNALRTLQAKREACGRLREATAVAAAIDKEHHKAAHATHLAACDAIAARWKELEETRGLQRLHNEAKQPRKTSHYTLPDLTPVAPPSYSGRHCRKGCACGNSCISCSKRCRH